MTMEQKTPEVRMTVDGHICVISLDNVAKKNAITPELMSQLSDAPDDLRRRRQPMGRRPGSGGRAHDRRPGHGQVLRSHRHGEADPEGSGRPVRPLQAHHQAGDLRRARHHLHDRHRDDAGGRHRHRGRHRTVLSARVEARDRAAGRCALPLPDPYGLGQRDVPSIPLRRVRRAGGVAHRVRARGPSVRQAPRARDGDRATDLQVRAPRAARDEDRRRWRTSSRASGRPSRPFRPSRRPSSPPRISRKVFSPSSSGAKRASRGAETPNA